PPPPQGDPSGYGGSSGRNRGFEGEDRGSNDYHRRESRGDQGANGRRDDGNGSGHRRGGGGNDDGRRGQQQGGEAQAQNQGRSERKRRGEGEPGGHEGKRRR
ncbi:hypothetical protein KCU89_g11751, partial [Aureobasidium melanogenum]